MDDDLPLDKYEQHVDLMNECRAFYYSRLQKTEHYKDIFIAQSNETDSLERTEQCFVSSLQKLHKEIVELLDQDLALMRQLLTLNEDIEEMKSRTFRGYSKESFCSSNSSILFQYGRHYSENETHLSTVFSECDMERMCQQDSAVFNDIDSFMKDNDIFQDVESTKENIESTEDKTEKLDIDTNTQSEPSIFTCS